MSQIGRLWSIVEPLVSPPVAERAERLFADIQGKGMRLDVARETAIALRFLPRQNAVVFDVGANRGEWSVALLARASAQISRLVLVEPQPSLIPILSNITAQEIQIEVIDRAVGRKSGEATLFADQPGSILASLTKRRLDHVGIAMTIEESVHVTTIDELAESRNLERIDLLKLDIEGHEFDALMGATRLLAEKRIGYLQFEFGGCNIDTRTYLRDFWHLFNDYGYEVGRLAKRSLIALPHYSERLEMFATTNYGAWPR
jgi:FkbM family methyltransferase